jgi:hypothetical protein
MSKSSLEMFRGTGRNRFDEEKSHITLPSSRDFVWELGLLKKKA